MPTRTKVTEPSTAVEEKPKTLVHDSKAFRVGDKVRILSKPTQPISGWGSSWNREMDATVGRQGVVISTSTNGIEAKLLPNGQTWMYPSCVLEVVRPKKRIRVGAGPWDAAPCTHLRWQLMGFFREKLVLVRATDGPAEVKVKCTKCNTEMTLKAQ